MRVHLATLVDDFRRHSGETAVVAHRGNRRYSTTYGALANLAGRVSAELDRRRILPGDRVILWGQNSAEWIAAFFGCLLRGVLAVPLDAAGSSAFAARVIADTTPKLIFADHHLLQSLPESAIPTLGFAALAETLPAEPRFAVDPSVASETPFQIVFTSGTTSEPRGIVHTHRNVLVTLEPIENEIAKYRKYERWFHPLRFLHSLPLSHVFGQFMGLWIPAVLSAEVHFSDQLEPGRLIALLRRERISVLIAVPRIQSLLRSHLLSRFPQLAAALDASAGFSIYKRWWRFRRIHSALGWKFWAVISGGATLSPELEAFWNRLGLALIQGYGMTETAALVTLNHPFHIAQGTIGKPLPGREVKINPEGEILVRGDMLAAATWSGGRLRPRDSEWLATGDLAESSASGELRFLGRKDDVIVTSAGLNIHPADLESALTAQPGIRAAVVVPCDLPAGPEPVAVVVTAFAEQQPGAPLQAAVAAANRTLADFQQIRRVLRWPELEFPYTSTGKLLRRQIAGWACAQLLQPTHPAATAQDTLLVLLCEITREPIPQAGDPNRLRLSADLHLDSLGRVQLQSALEQRFALDLDDEAIASAQTVADLRTLLQPPSTHDLQPDTYNLNPSARQSPAESPRGAPEESASAPDAAARPAPPSPEPHLYPRWPWTPPIQAIRVLFPEIVMRPLVRLLAGPRVIYSAGAAPFASGTWDSSRLSPGQTAEAPPALNQASTATGAHPPCLLIANHVTAYDGALILYALPPHLRRHVAAAMSGEMLLDLRRGRNQSNAFFNLVAPIGYWLVTALFNVFPLPRARGFRRSFAHAGEALDRGFSVLLFPEGTRSRTGELAAFRPGIGLLAQQSGVSILPIALVGLGELRATHARWFRSGKLEVRIGPLISAPAEDADPAQITAALEHTLRSLLTVT